MTYGSRCRAAATGPYLAGARPAGRRAGRGMSWAAAGARAAVLAPGAGGMARGRSEPL